MLFFFHEPAAVWGAFLYSCQVWQKLSLHLSSWPRRWESVPAPWMWLCSRYLKVVLFQVAEGDSVLGLWRWLCFKSLTHHGASTEHIRLCSWRYMRLYHVSPCDRGVCHNWENDRFNQIHHVTRTFPSDEGLEHHPSGYCLLPGFLAVLSVQLFIVCYQFKMRGNTLLCCSGEISCSLGLAVLARPGRL